MGIWYLAFTLQDCIPLKRQKQSNNTFVKNTLFKGHRSSTVRFSKIQQKISRPWHARRQLDIPAILGPRRMQEDYLCICKKKRRWVYMGHDLIKGGKTRFKKGRHYMNKSGQVNRRQACPTDQLEVKFHSPRICFQHVELVRLNLSRSTQLSWLNTLHRETRMFAKNQYTAVMTTKINILI